MANVSYKKNSERIEDMVTEIESKIQEHVKKNIHEVSQSLAKGELYKDGWLEKQKALRDELLRSQGKLEEIEQMEE